MLVENKYFQVCLLDLKEIILKNQKQKSQIFEKNVFLFE